MLSTAAHECPAELLAKTEANPPLPTAIVNATSGLVLDGARQACEHGIIAPVLIGDAETIKQEALAAQWDISKIPVVPSANEQEAAATAVRLARQGEVAALMKGDVHTDTLLRAVLDRKVGLRTGRHLSHLFHMTCPGSPQALCITDAVINVLPTVEQKLDIARNAIDLLHALGTTHPRIAALSASEVASAAMPSSVEAKTLCDLAATVQLGCASIDGPLAFDVAVSEQAAKIKGVGGPVAGHADVLLVPNIETGNALFKMMVYFMSATAAGLVLGAKVPIMLTSRADPAPARLASAALAAVYAPR